MPIYTSSKGEQKETADMPYSYLQNALKKATEEGNQDNIDALNEEIMSRPEAQNGENEEKID